LPLGSRTPICVTRGVPGWRPSSWRTSAPLARVGLVYSQQSAWFVGNKLEDHTLGWYQALIEARIPFEMVHDRLFDSELKKCSPVTPEVTKSSSIQK